jgi:hypothetical protein
MPVQIPYIDIFSGSRNKPQSAPPHQKHARAGEDQERPFTLLPRFELAGLRQPRRNARTTLSALVRTGRSRRLRRCPLVSSIPLRSLLVVLLAVEVRC